MRMVNYGQKKVSSYIKSLSPRLSNSSFFTVSGFKPVTCDFTTAWSAGKHPGLDAERGYFAGAQFGRVSTATPYKGPDEARR